MEGTHIIQVVGSADDNKQTQRTDAGFQATEKCQQQPYSWM
jgi:hypothetical protein